MMRAGLAKVAAAGLDSLSLPELLAAGDELQTLTCQLPTQSHRILARLQAEATPKEMGAKSWKDVLAIRWRISTAEAHRRDRREHRMRLHTSNTSSTHRHPSPKM